MTRLRARQSAEYAAALAVMILAWWYASGPMGMPRYLLPSPQATLGALVDIARTGELWGHLAFTLSNIFMGLAIGAVAGIALAWLLVRLPRLAVVLDGPLVVLQTAPKIALAPLFIVWFGLGTTAKVILIVSLVFFPVLMGALAGFRGIDSRLHDLARMMGLGPLARLWRIDLMAALPGIFVGLKVGAVQALVGAILAEWMSGQQGLGYLMTLAAATYKTPLLFGAVVLTAVLGIVLHASLTLAETRLLHWKAPDVR